MAFYLNQKNALLYRLSPNEQVDQDAYGMLRNNAVEHIVGVNYGQLDDRRELRFATEGLTSARDCFSHRVFNRQQFVDLLMGVADAFAAAEEYMLSTEAFSNSLDTTFVDDGLNVYLTYVPITGFTSCAGARVFIRDVRRCLQPDGSSGDLSYLQAIDGALNQTEGFSVAEFKKLLASLTLKPKQSGLSSTGTGQGFAPIEDSFASGLGAGSGSLSFDQHLDDGALPGQLSFGAGLGVGGASQSGFGQPPISSSGGGASIAGDAGATGGGLAIPSAGGFSSMFGGMAIPGMEGQQVPIGGPPEKKGLFGKGKKDKKATAKMGRAEKKAAKEAEKAAEKAAKEAKRRKKGTGSGGGKSGGLFSRKKPKEPVDAPIPPQGGAGVMPFPVPGGGQGVVPTGNGAAPVAPGVSPQGDAAMGQGQVVPPLDSVPQPIVLPPQAGPVGEQYSDNDFGITEVYGVEPKGGAGNGGEIPRLFGSQAAPRGLPVTAYLYRESTGEKRLIDKTPFRVGRRRSEVDFHIAEKPKVSRVHAIITFDGSRFMIRDNKSVNHTAINGYRIDPEETIALVSGDSIEMGDERFRFTLE